MAASPGFAQTATPTPGPLTLSSSQPDICQGGSVTLRANGGFDPGTSVTYTWTPTTDLSAPSGPTVVVAPLSTTTYTVTSHSPLSDIPTRSKQVTVTVNANCCQLNSGAIIVDLEYDEYGDVQQFPNGTPPGFFRPDPFAAHPPGTYFRVASGNSLLLINMEFNMPAGSVLLMGAGSDITLDDARLNLNGSTITAECDEMWGTVRMLSHAHDINLSASGTMRNRIMHSTGGITVDDALNTGPTRGVPQFKLNDTDFLHNHQSINITRPGGVFGSNSIANCTFDSDPALMKVPYNQTSPSNYYYADRHIQLDGNFANVAFSQNSFRHALIHVFFPNSASKPNVLLTTSRFSDFYIAGVLQRDATSNTLDPTRRIAVDECVFAYFQQAAPPATAQVTASRLYNHTFLPPGVPGISSRYSLLDVTNSLFTQPDTKAYSTFDYAERTEQTGINGIYVNQVRSNTFAGLHQGVRHELLNGDTRAEVKGNVFTECAKGYDFVASGGGVDDPGTVWLDCNTFTRGVSAQDRPGTAYGIYVEQGTVAHIDDPSTAPTRNITFLRNRFDVDNYDPSEFEAIHNDNGAYQLAYYTYNDVAALYDSFVSSGVQLLRPSPTSPVNSTPGNECAPDFPGAGIQRPTVTVASPVQSSELGQNAPNPTADRTTFYYKLLPGTRKAELSIRRLLDGVEIDRLPLNLKADNQEVSLRTYPAGIYLYTLLANDGPVATRRLIIR